MTVFSASAAGSKRAEQLQFLRFLAFLNVFIYHCDQWNVFGYPSSNAGAFSVSFFFLLSGLVSGYSGVGKDISLTPKVMVCHLWKKLKKLYPLYALTMVLPMVLSPLPQQVFLGDPAAGPGLWNLARCLLLIQSWFTEGYFAINGVGWYVSTLMFLYLFQLPGVWLLNRANRNKYGFWILTGMLGALFGVTVVYCYLTRSWDIDYWQYIFPPARLGEFLGGMILGFLVRDMEAALPQRKGREWIYTLLEVGALVLWLFFLTRFGSPWRRKIVNWLIPNTALLAVFTLGRGWVSRLLRNKWLVWLGDISYECFLIHNLILIRFGFYNHIPEDLPLACIGAMAACLGLTLLTAVMLHRARK